MSRRRRTTTRRSQISSKRLIEAQEDEEAKKRSLETAADEEKRRNTANDAPKTPVPANRFVAILIHVASRLPRPRARPRLRGGEPLRMPMRLLVPLLAACQSPNPNSLIAEAGVCRHYVRPGPSHAPWV